MLTLCPDKHYHGSVCHTVGGCWPLRWSFLLVNTLNRWGFPKVGFCGRTVQAPLSFLRRHYMHIRRAMAFCFFQKNPWWTIASQADWCGSSGVPPWPYLCLELRVEAMWQVSPFQGLGDLSGPEHLAAGYHHLARPGQHPIGSGLLWGAKSTTHSSHKTIYV